MQNTNNNIKNCLNKLVGFIARNAYYNLLLLLRYFYMLNFKWDSNKSSESKLWYEG